MNLNNYIKEAIKTEIVIEEVKVNTRLNHGIMGVVTGVGELLLPFVDIENSPWAHVVRIKEEVGGILWHLAILMDEMSLNYDDIDEIEMSGSNCNDCVFNLVAMASSLQDDLMKHIYNDNSLDYDLIEDIVAMIVINLRSISKELDFTLEDVAEANINKLNTKH